MPPSGNIQNLFIHSLLVRPIYPRNIGQAVRATMNMGYGKVFLIDPQCEINEEARQGAAGAQKELEERQVFSNWQSFNNKFPNAYRIGLSRRIGKHRKLFPFEKGVENFFNAQKDFPSEKKEFFLVFGPEDHGLSTEDLEHVNICCHLPLYGNFKSLNLAQAVLLSQHIAHSIYFEKYIKSFKPSSEDKGRGDFLKEQASEDFFPDESLMKWLTSMGFRIDPKQLNAFETLKKMILRSCPSQKELGTFEKALRQSVSKMANKTS